MCRERRQEGSAKGCNWYSTNASSFCDLAFNVGGAANQLLGRDNKITITVTSNRTTAGNQSPTSIVAVQFQESYWGPPNPPENCHASTSGAGMEVSWQTSIRKVHLLSTTSSRLSDRLTQDGGRRSYRGYIRSQSSSAIIRATALWIAYVWAVNKYGYSDPCSHSSEFVGDDPRSGGPLPTARFPGRPFRPPRPSTRRGHHSRHILVSCFRKCGTVLP